MQETYSFKESIMKHLLAFLIFSCSNLFAFSQQFSLEGMWTVNTGNEKQLSIVLPGTLDDAGIGNPVPMGDGLDISTLAHLSRKVQYVGKAFYNRSFTSPVSFRNKKIFLTLDRVLWRSSVLVDGKKVPGEEESLSTSQRYDLSNFIIPGKQQAITICVDNSNIYPGINENGKNYLEEESKTLAHAYTNHTQIKWNGILGHISLSARPSNFIEQVNVQSDLQKKILNVKVNLQQQKKSLSSIFVYVMEPNSKKRWQVNYNKKGTLENDLNFDIPFAPDAKVWDEFSPTLYELVTVLKSSAGEDTVRSSFGIRDLKVSDRNLSLNGHRLFIRGNLECVIFPLTGYPLMKEQQWMDLYIKAKAWGLNSFRFHSWCPPEAAFAAADKIGFYLQAELPHWNLKVGEDTAAFNFLTAEAHRMLNAYGNHPSFMFFSMGNELEGDFKKLNALVFDLKKIDNRRLYSTTTFTFQKGITRVPQPADDFFVTQWTKKGWVRGQGIFNDVAPNFSTDYSKASDSVGMPLISHEIGQYSVYPDLSEIPKYTGNLVANNFIQIKKDIESKKMLALAPRFLEASGKFATILYKEEIERALKTKSFDGFQLLQLQDFPGQGTALVGLLNAFWQSKGFTSAEEFHKFCSEVTPLARFDKAVYTNNEVFNADIELANFYKPLKMAELNYTITDDAGKVLLTGNFPKKDFDIDNGLAVGKIIFNLDKIIAARKLNLTVAVNGTSFSNNWSFWVYPNVLPSITNKVVVTSSLGEAVKALELGSKVLLSPLPDTLNGITGKFVPVFWSPIHFPNQPGTMGLLIKSKHEALKHFPSDNFSNWQWWDLVIHSKALNVEGLSDEYNLVKPIDNFVRNQNLSSLFEAKVLKGQLVFCSIDIVNDLERRPQARQLRYSLLKYMDGENFLPGNDFGVEQLRTLFK